MDKQNDQAALIKSFSLIASMALLLFGLVQWYGSDVMVGITEVVAGFVVLINLLVYLQFKNPTCAKTVLVLAVFAVLIVLLQSGGIYGTGIFWWFMFPIAVFFLVGRKQGLGWIVALCIASIVTTVLDIDTPTYHPVVIRQMWAVLAVVTALAYLYDRRREQSQQIIELDAEVLKTEEARLKTLYEITTKPALSLPEQIQAALKIGAQSLGSKLAIVSRIESDKFTILYCVTPPNTVIEGDVFELKETYCDITVKKNEVLAINHMAQSEYKAHTCYGKFHLESYIGVPVMVEGKLFGTLNFSSPDPKSPQFTESDQDFVRLLGKWVSATVEHELLAEKATEVDKMKSEFVSLASHQLRTPLTGVKWFTDLLLRGVAGKLSKDQTDYVQQIATSNERLITLVEDLLNVSHIETGQKFNLEMKPTDIVPIIHSLKADLVALAAQHKVTINLEKLPEKLILNVDSEKIREVFQNLLSNAIKYSNDDGEVEVGISKQTPTEVILYVKDNGLGIPEAQQARMFEKFFRADNVQTKETSGTGLGMYIAKIITEKHGGKLWFESKENTGTTFYVQLARE